MKATVYQSKGFLYVKVDVKGDGKENLLYYSITESNGDIKFNASVRSFIRNLPGIEFNFEPKGAIENSLTADQLVELRLAAQKAWKEKKQEEPKVTALEDEDDEHKKPDPEKKSTEKFIRTFINDKAIGDKVYADLVAETELSAKINNAIKSLGYDIIKKAADPISFTLENDINGLIINILSDGTMILDTSKAKKEITTKDTEDAVSAIKQTYNALGVAPEHYSFEAKPVAAAAAKGIRAATSAATNTANPRNGYHYYLKTYTKEINKLINPHHYEVDPVACTLKKNKDHQIIVNDDGSTEGKLFSDLSDASVAQNIANDHIAVIKMHLALMDKGIFPDQNIVNLFLIQKNLSTAQQAQVPALQAEIKRLIEIEFAKNDYNDIRAMIRYEGQPLGAPAPAPSAPPASLKISGDPKPPAPAADDDKENDKQPTSKTEVTKADYLDFLAKLNSPDPKISARALQDIINGNNVFFDFKDVGFGKATGETGGFRFKPNAEEIFNQLEITPADVDMDDFAFKNYKNKTLNYSSAAGILRNGIQKVYSEVLKLTENPFGGLDKEDNQEFQNALKQVLNFSPRPK